MSAVWHTLRILALALFLGGALFSGYLFYDTMRDLLDQPVVPVDARAPSNTNPPSASNNRPPSNPASEASQTQPVPSPIAAGNPAAQDQVPHWNGKERVNFLLMGIDRRPGETGATQTDTLIIVSVDPTSKSVSMLSIPRDLWVPIPGYGENRINTAFWMGISHNYPGGGFALVKKTVQYNFGVPIHYYIMVNFVGFRKVVDALGGITVDVPRDIYDPTFPNDTYGYRPLYIKKGRQHMNGQQALDYARTRHVDSDFGRMKRQQQVLMTIKDKALNLDVIPKLPALWAAKDDSVQTDLRLQDIIALTQLAKDVKSENIKTAEIDDSLTQDWVTPGGAMVLLPDREKIRRVVAQLFSTTSTAQTEPADQIKRISTEAARIQVSNGTSIEGVAGRVSEWLKAQGFNIVLVDNAEREDFTQTLILESSDKPATRGALATLFKVSADRVRKGSAATNIDIHLVIGRDFDLNVLPNSQ